MSTYSLSIFLLLALNISFVAMDSDTSSTWIVRSRDTDEACIIASGDVRIRLVVAGEMENVTVDEEIPAGEVTVDGECGDDEAELKLVWPDELSGEDNMLNLVVSRNGRLAGLTGAFVRLQVGAIGKRESHAHDSVEMMTKMDFRDIITPVWPLRYGLNCPQSQEFPLYPAPIHLLQNDIADIRPADPTSFLIVENLRLEAFRDESTVDIPELQSGLDFFHRRTWECEFHFTLDWAPVVVGCGLAGLVVFMVTAFFCKRSMGKKRNKYDLM